MLLGKAGCGSDENRDLHQSCDSLQITCRCLDLRQDVDCTEFRCLLAGFYVEILAQETDGLKLPVGERQLASCQEKISGLGEWNIVRGRRCRCRDCHTKV